MLPLLVLALIAVTAGAGDSHGGGSGGGGGGGVPAMTCADALARVEAVAPGVTAAATAGTNRKILEDLADLLETTSEGIADEQLSQACLVASDCVRARARSLPDVGPDVVLTPGPAFPGDPGGPGGIFSPFPMPIPSFFVPGSFALPGGASPFMMPGHGLPYGGA